MTVNERGLRKGRQSDILYKLIKAVRGVTVQKLYISHHRKAFLNYQGCKIP